MPTVLLVTPWSPDAIGGVSEVVVNLHRAFAGAGILRPRILVEAYPHRTVIEAQTETLGPVDCLYLPQPSGRERPFRHALGFLARFPGALLRLCRYLSRHAVAAINIHYPSPSLFSLLLAARLYNRRVPVVLSFHGADLNAARSARPFDRWLWRQVIRHCDAAVACSHALDAEVRAVLPDVRGKLHVIHNGVDVEACRRLARSVPHPEALRGRGYLACVATFEHKKGQDVLLAAFRAVAQDFPDLHLALVGRSGPTLEPLRASLAADPLRGRVSFFPDCSHARALAISSAAALLVHPARQEPFGIVLLEAAALGVPIVASGVGGIPEIVEDGYSGRLVPADDPGALADAITELLRDRNAAQAYARALAARVEARFSWQAAIAAYACLFKTARGPALRNGARHSAG
ncbi:MAG TPA: glycosyltransferase family 4 protein [Alphaproteobacteria bacterium]|nr:glycosyltransferase family 4 protein [Alphaproteobacteria bacterium]